jgi:hypothetical protein
VMSVDDALALAEHVLAAYGASCPGDAPGPDLLWSDQLARALRELAAAASVRHVTPFGARPPAMLAHAGEPGDDAASPGGGCRGRVRDGLARVLWRRVGRASEPRTVVLSAADADTAWQALADAGAWHGVYGDCAVCVGNGVCGEKERHEVIAVQYAALRAWLGGDRR